ncbi:MAG TPA: N-acetylmuramoyl-L-alanine amidase [Saprospiraceae bacterium]|nr:N-acetylmuramoyl-L-alanine amidase [Saprospiraceae bacterium]HMP25006.1 N-acetylmuramoyl-L-alanine amidase [Saprospiraceae bacterium]
MFAKFISAIKSMFATLFGSSKNEPAQPETPRPRPDKPTENQWPQDAAEVAADTVVIVTNEMDTVVLPPTPTGKDKEDFDKDIFAEETTPAPAPTPVPPVTPPTPATPAPAPSAPAARKQRYLWCLDNGHGSRTPGKRSPEFEFGGKTVRLLEYEFNRDIVRRMIERLEKEGIKYYNVVPEVDIDDFLQGRVDRANNKRSSIPKIYVSIHANASQAANLNTWGADSASGIETWHHANSAIGRKTAAIFQRHIVEKTGFRNRHLKTTEQLNLFVLRRTNMPAILTENGFYNNRREAVELMKDEVRQKIADAHVEAILEIEKNGL